MTYLLRPMIAALPYNDDAQEVRDWLDSTLHLTLADAWPACVESKWLFWLGIQVMPHETLVLALCDVAESVLHLVPAGEDRPRIALETARRRARGEVTVEEMRAVASATDTSCDNAAWRAAFYVTAYAAYAAYIYDARASHACSTYAAADTACAYAVRACAYTASAYAYAKRAGLSEGADPLDVCAILRARMPAADVEAALVVWCRENAPDALVEVPS